MGLSGPISKMLTGLAFFLAICSVAVVGYMWAGATLIDAVYMVIITIFAVGYEEVVDVNTPALQGLTIGLIVMGYVAVVYTIGGFMQLLIDGELNKALGARRMMRDIELLEQHTIICGMGRMGSILAKELAQADRPFVVIDCDEFRIQAAEEQGYLVIRGDATEESVLERAGIEKARSLASVLSEDAINVFVTVTARAMKPDLLIIARGENPRTEKKLLSCGADRVILPTAIGAAKVAQLVIRPSAESMLEQLANQAHMNEELQQIGLQFDELRVEADSSLAGRSLSEIEVRGNHGFLVVGIRHQEGRTSINPDGSTMLNAGDVVIILGHNDDIPQLAKRFTAKREKITYRGATMES